MSAMADDRTQRHALARISYALSQECFRGLLQLSRALRTCPSTRRIVHQELRYYHLAKRSAAQTMRSTA